MTSLPTSSENSLAIIFTDGSSRGNPGPGGWGAITIENGKVRELGGGERETTNNRMEIKASVEGLKAVTSHSVKIYTDSSYLIKGATQWVFGWQKNGWKSSTKEEVKNQDLWQELISVMKGKKIDWQYVGGHVGIVGNERCDVIATSFADEDPTLLYVGELHDYSLPTILDIKASEESVVAKSQTKKRSSAPAYSYISSVDGKIEVHSTWSDCEKRVKGKSGARFKKSLNQSEEKSIIDEFSKN